MSKDLSSQHRMVSELFEELTGAAAVELKKGECTFHHPLMVHGSFENRTDRPRRATVINVVRDGVTSNTDQPLLQGVPVVPRGKPLEGRFHPLLYNPGGLGL